jgi:hypothetical protein
MGERPSGGIYAEWKSLALSCGSTANICSSHSSPNDHRLRSQHLVSRLLSICAPLNELTLFSSSTINHLTLREAGSALMDPTASQTGSCACQEAC